MFKGSITALVTPFLDGRIDEAAFRSLVEWQMEEGSHGLVPCGTTGESPTLSHPEHKRLVELTIEVTGKRVPVIAGAGSNSTDEAIDFSRHAEKAGADALLVVRKKVFIAIFERSMRTSRYRSSSTTFRAAALSTYRSILSRASTGIAATSLA